MRAIFSERKILENQKSLLHGFDPAVLGENFKWNQVSHFENLIESKSSCFFSLQLFEVNQSDDIMNLIVQRLDSKIFRRSYFIISEGMSHYISHLLCKGAFDVMCGGIRVSEFKGKLEYFFSIEYQSYLLKNHSLFHLDLTKKEQKLFDFLVMHPEGVTREQMMTICWKNVSVHPKTLDVHLFNLRQKLELVGGDVSFRHGSWYLYFNPQSAIT